MDLRQLEMFVAVAENSSFTLAGQQLHVAQSAISRKIRMLEEELGEQLFKRIKKRIYLTEAGSVLLRYSRRIFQELRAAAVEVSDYAHLQRGTVKIAAGLTACVYLVPPVLEDFLKIYPNIEVLVSTDLTEALVERLRHGSIDLGVLTLPISSPDLEVVPVFREELVVVSSGRHPQLSKRHSISAHELSQYPMILYVKGASMRTLVERFFVETDIAPRIVMESESFATIKPLVEINLGISILPFCAVQAEVRRGELHCIHVDNHTLSRRIGLVFQKAQYRPKLVAELVRLFRERYMRSSSEGNGAEVIAAATATGAVEQDRYKN
jgi:DNA-binding transcriptional LysR family regulator